MEINKPELDQIICKLESQKKNSSDVIFMSDYTDGNRQRVAVCEHIPEDIGEYHTHDFFEVNYVYSGSCINLIEEDLIRMSEGDVVIMHPGTFHNLYASAESKVYNFLIDKKWLCDELSAMKPFGNEVGVFFGEAGNKDFYKHVLFHITDKDELVTSLAEKVVAASKSESHWKYLYMEAALLEYLGLLSDRASGASLSLGRGQSSSVMIDMLGYIEKNCDTVNLDILSEKYFYSKSYISRMFLKNTGKNFNKLLMDIRLRRACAMLDDTDMPAEKIAHLLGYESAQYFHRLFKKSMGVTPGEYKNRNR